MVTKYSILASIFLAIGFVILLVSLYAAIPKKPQVNGVFKYTCPTTEWIDCMPIVAPERQFECEKPYLDWVKINCPNFKGTAL